MQVSKFLDLTACPITHKNSILFFTMNEAITNKWWYIVKLTFTLDFMRVPNNSSFCNTMMVILNSQKILNRKSKCKIPFREVFARRLRMLMLMNVNERERGQSNIEHELPLVTSQLIPIKYYINLRKKLNQFWSINSAKSPYFMYWLSYHDIFDFCSSQSNPFNIDDVIHTTCYLIATVLIS